MEKITYTKEDVIREVTARINDVKEGRNALVDDKKKKEPKLLKRDVKEVVEILGDVIEEYLAETTPDCNIEVKGLSGVVFKGSFTEGRIGRNPLTGESITIAPKVKVKAAFAPSYKNRINGGE